MLMPKGTVTSCFMLVRDDAGNLVAQSLVDLSYSIPILKSESFAKGSLQFIDETLSHVHKVGRLDTESSVTATYLVANISQRVNVRTKQLEDRVKTLHKGITMLFRVGDYLATFRL